MFLRLNGKSPDGGVRGNKRRVGDVAPTTQRESSKDTIVGRYARASHYESSWPDNRDQKARFLMEEALRTSVFGRIAYHFWLRAHSAVIIILFYTYYNHILHVAERHHASRRRQAHRPSGASPTSGSPAAHGTSGSWPTGDTGPSPRLAAGIPPACVPSHP